MAINIDEKLSTKEYWNDVLKNANLPRINTSDVYNYRITMNFIHDVIIGSNCQTLIEIGCGSSGWLPYFAKRYNLKVSGLDYSEIGCKLVYENLKMQNIEFDDIVCKDIFEPDCTKGKKYDIVFSYGVIEHFENPQDLIKILSNLLNPKGIIITLVPNLNGLPGLLSWIFVNDVYKMHKVITKEQLRWFHLENGLLNLKTKYVGIFSLAVIPWIRSKNIVFRKNSIQRKIALKIIDYSDFLFSSIFKFIKVDISTKLFSPYVICIAQK